MRRDELSPQAPALWMPPHSDWTPPPGDAILTPEQVAAWLQVKPRQVAELGIPTLDFGHKTKRYLARDVYAYIEAKRKGGQAA